MKKLLPLALAFTSTITFANDAKIDELQQQINALAEQLESLSVPTSNTTLGGYGELHYNNYDNATNKIDFHRYVLFVGHEFDETTHLFSEFELEHAIAGAGKVGEIELEQAYIQFDRENSNIKAGVFLIPVGIINETHEPTAFYGTERNPVEKNIIPATWWEAGVMYSGHTNSGISYDVAIHSGLNTNTTIRSGRQNVGKATANDLAYTGRIKYTGVAGLEVATTLNQQTNLDQTAGGIGAATLVEMHAIYSIGKIKLTGLTANWNINGATNTNGSVLEASYKVSPKIGVFARQNNWNDGVAKSQFDAGVNYWPHEDVVVKFDIQQQDANAGNTDGFNIGLGYQF